MYFPSIKEIKDLRIKLKLSQKELAKKSNVSQSLIAKIEKNKINPSYETIVKIFSTLEELLKENRKKAKEVMNRNVVVCFEETTVKNAVTKMVKLGFSQMPVISKFGRITGYISEEIILKNIDKIKNETKVKEIMDTPPPLLNEETPLDIIYKLLETYPMIIILNKKGNLSGIITKTDILKKGILKK